MGCDIHFFAERKYKTKWTRSYPDGKTEEHQTEGWLKIGKKFKNTYFDVLEAISDYNEIVTDQPYRGRNYTLFAFLADVRNYWDVEPLAQPRGIPKDISDDLKEVIDDWGGDGHSHSWFTLKELLDADWNQTITKSESLTKKQQMLFEKTHRPPEGIDWEGRDSMQEVEWSEYLFEQCEEFREALRGLRRYAEMEEIPYEDIRCVFFFDN